MALLNFTYLPHKRLLRRHEKKWIQTNVHKIGSLGGLHAHVHVIYAIFGTSGFVTFSSWNQRCKRFSFEPFKCFAK